MTNNVTWDPREVQDDEREILEQIRIECQHADGTRTDRLGKFAGIDQPKGYPTTCPTCKGTGGGTYNDCPTCDGNGVI